MPHNAVYYMRLHLTRRGVLETVLILERCRQRHPSIFLKLRAKGYLA